MVRLALLVAVLVISAIIWAIKASAGAVSGNGDLKNTTLQTETKKTMDKAARGINWLNEQWEQSKHDADTKDRGAAHRAFKDYDDSN